MNTKQALPIGGGGGYSANESQILRTGREYVDSLRQQGAAHDVITKARQAVMNRFHRQGLAGTFNDKYLRDPSTIPPIEEWLKDPGMRGIKPVVPEDVARGIKSGAAEEHEETEGKGELTPEQEQKILEFVKATPNLDDSAFHAFCEGLGVDPHEGEEVIYRAVNEKKGEDKPAIDIKAFLTSGASKNKGYVKPDQMRKGMKVEEEHTKGLAIPKPMQKVIERKIVKDHVAGEKMPNYYDHLGPMETKAKKEAALTTLLGNKIMSLSHDKEKPMDVIKHAFDCGFAETCQANNINPTELVKAAQAYGGYKGMAFNENLPIGRYRQNLTRAEQEDIDAGKSQIIPTIFRSKGTPLPELMASPVASGVGGGLLGGGLGGLLGLGVSGGSPAMGIGGAGLGGLLGYLLASKSREARNATLEDYIRRLPPGMARIRDMEADPIYQKEQDRLVQGQPPRSMLTAALLAGR